MNISFNKLEIKDQVFVTLLSCLFLKEACGLFEIFNLLLVLGGITLVIQPPFIFGKGEVNIKYKYNTFPKYSFFHLTF